MATKKVQSKPAVKKKRKKKAQQNNKRIILFVAEMIILVVLLVVLYMVLKADKVNKISIDKENIVVNETVENNVTLKGYRNIALFGVDARDKSLGKGNRTDTIMIASINQETGDIKLVSVYRDTYLNLGNDTYNKCNAAYAKGGPEQAINMLNMNLDLNIEDYITVGFTGLIDVIDALGGVEVEITEQEMKIINDTLWEYEDISGEKFDMYDYLWEYGNMNLTGPQATAYARIRSTAGDDFKRTSRQRIVLEAMLNKAKEAKASTLLDICEVAFENISTSLNIF